MDGFTSSPGEKTFEVKIWSPTEPFSRIWVQVLDRNDGSFVVRYRMYASYTDLHVQVLLQDKNVAQSPYVLKGAVYHEGCDCPEPDGAVWAEQMHCPASFAQIDRDLAAFPEVHLQSMAQEIPHRFGQRHSLCHYTIRDNKVYIKTHGEHVGFRIFMDAILLSLTRKVRLPDLEFFVNLGDWPLEKRRSPEKLHPILSWCGSNDTQDIVMPTYDLTESVLETMGRVSLDMLSVQGNSGPVWARKNSSAIWRGRDSRRERLELVKMARIHPHVLDAAFTNFFFFQHDPDLYGPLVKHMSFFSFFKYKYQINIDGTVAAYRLPYLLVGGSVVLKQDSPYYEHFYSQLRPWQHYIPFKADLSDLLDKIRWARNHDDEARKIALAGQEFARTHLMGDNIFCYYFRLFQEYAKRQVTEPEVREGMELVEQPKDDLFPCYCHHTQLVNSSTVDGAVQLVFTRLLPRRHAQNPMAECSEETVKIPFGEKCLDAVVTIPDEVAQVRSVLLLTHGAGGDMNFRHLVSLAQAVAARGHLCMRFTCKALNLAHRVKAYRAALKYLKSHDRFTITSFFLGGRSMGARAAVSLTRHLEEEGDECVRGVVCVSFPLHPPAQTHTHQQRSEDLRALSQQPLLFISGTADNMCERKLLEKVVQGMQAPTAVRWIEGASHGLAVRGRAEEAVLEEVNTHITDWMCQQALQ
ncbi:hypothetical protein ACEWY4_022650 [Coilia grayii]|uniref:Glycosyl transferase CAP10 domain-containing protein n=1 Tax=Coilia grayii TaxID=363190 RepID=A0ABD1J0X3_9TELE